MGPTKRVKTPENHHRLKQAGWVGIFWDVRSQQGSHRHVKGESRKKLTENLSRLKGFLPPKKLDQNVRFSRLIWVQKICNKEISSNKNCTRCFLST